MSRLKKMMCMGAFDGDSSDEDQTPNMVQMLATEFHRRQAQQNNQQIKHVGSSSGRNLIHRDRVSGHNQLVTDYFADNPVYPPNIFRRRFRMQRSLFLSILDAIQHHDDYFIQKNDAAGVAGLSGLQKMTAAFRMLQYGVPADAVDEYVKIGESTAIEAMKKFCRAIVHVYGETYLRSPNEEDVSRLLQEANKRGFPGMLGSLDCMHWKWEKCPTAWHGQFTGHVDKPTLILEAVASYDLWIWHCFFGMPGSNNDINVLHRSHLFCELAQGRAPPANFVVNGHQYSMGYYLADGIYPQWATLVQTISNPQGGKKKLFAQLQEAYRKDVERAFGVLQSRFAIIRNPARFWYRDDLSYVMKTCVILHNMIIEDERDEIFNEEPNEDPPVSMSRMITPTFRMFLDGYRKIRSSESHHLLRNDLIEHLWAREGELN